jgi:ketosteroid isomerase-like protein
MAKGMVMDEVEAFLSQVIPRLEHELGSLQNGDAGPRKMLWSHREPVSLFGAERSACGWSEVEPVFDRLAASFSNGQSCSYEVFSAGVSGDLGYVAAIEHSVASTGGGKPEQYTLRVTTIFRREEQEWKVVHRHGDPLDQPSRDVLARRREQGAM